MKETVGPHQWVLARVQTKIPENREGYLRRSKTAERTAVPESHGNLPVARESKQRHFKLNIVLKTPTEDCAKIVVAATEGTLLTSLLVSNVARGRKKIITHVDRRMQCSSLGQVWH
jgi:hypothetical protein